MKQVFQPDWRTQNRVKRRIYSKYMGWLEKFGYLVVLGVLGAFVFAFNYRVDDVVKADGVKLEPAATAIQYREPILVAKVLVDDFAEVRKGQPLMEIVQGEVAILKYQSWAKLDDLRKVVGSTPEIDRLGAQYTKPKVEVVASPIAGTFRLDFTGAEAEADTVLARVVDYNDLRLTASLDGQTVPQASVGQYARVTAINIGSADKTIFRGSSPSGPALSGQLIGARARGILEEGLKGASIQLRDDVPLEISDVGELQVDARIDRSPTSGEAKAISLDPPANYVLRAQVIEGTPSAVVQIADLPPDLQERVRASIKEAIQNRVIQDLDGSLAKLVDAKDVRLVVKLNAKGRAKDSALKLQGTMISRKFDAKLKVESPPPFLVQAVREADRSGSFVTSRVELVTGNRPIAFILLKKS
ncbi:MAG: hypothetical protein H7Y17_13425 [Chlorobia bacterium]|nr:hypothetical protein [Fimbriimonadaceae bacterium]